MKLTPKERLPAMMAASCLLGLAASPLLFLLIGAGTGMLFVSFPPAFFYVMLPFLFAGIGFLSWLYLPQAEKPGKSRLRFVGEVASWCLVVDFLVYVSSANLQVGFERIGMVSILFLLTWVICLPVVWFRRTALEQKLAHVSSPAALMVSLTMVTSAVVAAIAYLMPTQRVI